jgi:hypothetical protein
LVAFQKPVLFSIRRLTTQQFFGAHAYTGDHVLLDSRCFAAFPADPKLVTVRTSAAGDRESRDSRPAPLSHQMLEEIRTGMLLTEVELNTGAAGAGSRNTSDSVS